MGSTCSCVRENSEIEVDIIKGMKQEKMNSIIKIQSNYRGFKARK